MREQEIKIPIGIGRKDLINNIEDYINQHSMVDGLPIRFAITKTDDKFYHCEIGILISEPTIEKKNIESIFRFKKKRLRKYK